MWRWVVLFFSLVTIAIASLWIDSHQHKIWLDWAKDDHSVMVASEGGLIWGVVNQDPRIKNYVKERGPGFHGARIPGGSDQLWRGLPRSLWGQTGFQNSYYVGPGSLKWQREYAMPFWFPTLIAGLFPAVWLYIQIKHWQRKRNRIVAGLCGQCGYDLRASPERCPECGAAVSRAVNQRLPANP